MSGTLDAKVVRITFEVGKTGRIFATSPDIKGLLIGRPTMDDLVRAIPQAISDMYAACGLQVVVSRLDRHDSKSDEWVAFPAEVAREALAAENRTAALQA